MKVRYVNVGLREWEGLVGRGREKGFEVERTGLKGFGRSEGGAKGVPRLERHDEWVYQGRETDGSGRACTTDGETRKQLMFQVERHRDGSSEVVSQRDVYPKSRDTQG